jgi:hypothetical protein
MRLDSQCLRRSHVLQSVILVCCLLSLLLHACIGGGRSSMIASNEPPGAEDYEVMDERFREHGVAEDQWMGRKYRAEIGVVDISTETEGTEFTGVVNAWMYSLYVANTEPMDVTPGDLLVVWGTMTGYTEDGLQILAVDYWRPASDAELSP